MADRSVKVSLILQATGYISGMEQVARKTRETGSEVEKLAQKREAFQQFGAAGAAAGAALGVGVGIAVSKFAEFDQQMSYVQASTHETTQNMGLLREAAIDAGAATVYSATEAAAAIDELAKAGVSTRDVLSGGLGGSLDLAAAGGLGVARAAEIMSTALNQYELDGTKAAHVSDVLAAGAGKAMGSVDDLAQGLKFVGPVAASMGVSLEETTGVLALFAQQGIIGEQAGTSLRGVLSSLTSPSSQARKEIERLGITLYDSQGNFLGLENAAGQLSQAYSTMDGASRDASLGIIFGRETVTAATALYKAGARGVAEWTRNVNDAGYAAETARIRLDNLRGDWEALGGAVDSALITMGSGANGPLRSGLQQLTGLVNDFNDLPDWMQQSALGAAAVAAGVGLIGGAALIGVPKIAQFKVALDTLELSRGRVAGGLRGFTSFLGGPWGIALLGATAAVMSFTAAIADGVPTQEALTNAATTSRNSLELLRTASARGSLETTFWGDYNDALSDLPALLDHATAAQSNWALALTTTVNQTGAYDSLKRIGSALAEMSSSDMPRATRTFRDLAESQGLTKEQQSQLLREMGPFRDALIQQATAAGLTADDQTLLALATGNAASQSKQATKASSDNSAALDELAGKASSAEVDVKGLADAIRGFGSAQLDTNSAARGFEQALDDLQDSINENGTSLDRTLQSGRDNEERIDAIARATAEWAAATVQQTGDQDAANKIIQDGRDQLIGMLEQFGISGRAAQDYADRLGLIPGNIPTAVELNVSTAQQQLTDFLTGIKNRQATLNVRVNAALGAGLSDQELAGMVGVGLPNYSGGFYEKTKVKQFEAGGFASGIYNGRAGGIHKFAEGNLPWEAYISPHPAYRQKNLAILNEVGYRLDAWQQPAPTAARGSGGVAVHIDSISIPPVPGLTAAEALSMIEQGVRNGIRDAMPGGSY